MIELLRILEAEALSVSRFVEVLKREQVALGQGDVDNLVGFAQDKAAISSELATFANRRNSILAGQGLKADRAGIEAWLDRQPANSGQRDAWSRIMALASEARELNRLNGELIRIRMQHNTQALEAIQGATSTLSLYGRDGQTTAVLSRRINDAA